MRKYNPFSSPAIPCFVNLCGRNRTEKRSYENHENVCQNDSKQMYQKTKNLQKLMKIENGYYSNKKDWYNWKAAENKFLLGCNNDTKFIT